LASAKVSAACWTLIGGWAGSPLGAIAKLPVIPSSIRVLKSSAIVPLRVSPRSIAPTRTSAASPA
jgi:hypothetical protein